MTEPRDYYNEIDPYCVAWLRSLIAANLIAPGDVDERPIQDVKPNDLVGYRQCHFFAGLGGWAYALRRAHFPSDRQVWTGSCPCQPFSVAGKMGGFADERHLWPYWHHLIKVGRPAIVLGEQVAGAADWLRLVRGDLEAVDYAVGAIPIEAASAGADHFRDRYWFVAHHDGQQQGDNFLQRGGQLGRPGGAAQDRPFPLADVDRERSQVPFSLSGDARSQRPPFAGNRVRDVEHVEGDGWGEGWTESEFRSRGFTAAVASIGGCQFVECPDGKWRRLPPPRVRWLGTRIPARIPKLRALGNSIDTRAAQAFIEAVMEIV